jgi:hypothetical protein
MFIKSEFTQWLLFVRYYVNPRTVQFALILLTILITLFGAEVGFACDPGQPGCGG